MSACRHAVTLYTASLLLMVLGSVLAARRFPGGFDIAYTVMSALASRKHNPEGGMWFSGALAVAMILLWPVASCLGAPEPGGTRPRIPIVALRTGLICGALLGTERFFIFHLSDLVYKAHELIAVLTFLGLYVGIVGLYGERMRHDMRFVWPALLVCVPLVAIGVGQALLWLGQRDVGWVDVAWRELGIPVWLSFAFWQWVAVALLWVGLGHLLMSRLRAATGYGRRFR